jgi:SpoVK/Ycf46/Vps4 family AAA+-type ATPase
LLSKVACSEIARRSNRKAYFVVVQAAAFESPWVGETQRQITECFSSLRQAAEHGPAILFIDEIDAMGRVRGGAVGHHSDKFLATLLTELDGFSRLKNVAIIAASNRKDLLDPALLSRMSTQISVKRPGLRAAQAILGVHLSESLPYHPNGASASSSRSEIIGTVVSRLYAPNSGNELCTLKFADGRTRVIAANEMVSGRLLSQICQSAKQSAFHRDASSGVRGIQLADIDSAVGVALEQLATSLSPQNVHHHLDDLADDEVVVSVVPHVSRVPNRQRYLTPARG